MIQNKHFTNLSWINDSHGFIIIYHLQVNASQHSSGNNTPLGWSKRSSQCHAEPSVPFYPYLDVLRSVRYADESLTNSPSLTDQLRLPVSNIPSHLSSSIHHRKSLELGHHVRILQTPVRSFPRGVDRASISTSLNAVSSPLAHRDDKPNRRNTDFEHNFHMLPNSLPGNEPAYLTSSLNAVTSPLARRDDNTVSSRSLMASDSLELQVTYACPSECRKRSMELPVLSATTSSSRKGSLQLPVLAATFSPRYSIASSSQRHPSSRHVGLEDMVLMSRRTEPTHFRWNASLRPQLGEPILEVVQDNENEVSIQGLRYISYTCVCVYIYKIYVCVCTSVQAHML